MSTITNFAIMVTCISAASPIITALINAKHDTNIRKLELDRERYKETALYKRDIFKNYLKYLNASARMYELPENENLYSRYYPLAYLYTPDDLRNEMAELNDLLDKEEYDKIIPRIEAITSKIAKIIETMSSICQS